MELRALKCFVWAADLGSITRAASELGIVQPALSRQIQRIEAELGVKLFARLHRGVQLTPAGHQFLEHARRILREVDNAKSELQGANAKVEGAVSIGLSPTLAPIVAPGYLEQVRRYLPQVRVKLVEGFSLALYDRLIGGTLDIALLTNPPRSRELRLVPLFAEPIIVVAGAGSGQSRRYYTLDEVCSQPLIVTSGIRATVEEQLRKLGRRLPPGLEIDSVEAIRRMLLAGSDPALVPVSTYRDDIEAGRLDAFPVVDANLQRLLVIASPTRVRGVAAIDQCVALLAQQITALADAGTFALTPGHRSAVAVRVAPKTRATRR